MSEIVKAIRQELKDRKRERDYRAARKDSEKNPHPATVLHIQGFRRCQSILVGEVVYVDLRLGSHQNAREVKMVDLKVMRDKQGLFVLYPDPDGDFADERGKRVFYYKAYLNLPK